MTSKLRWIYKTIIKSHDKYEYEYFYVRINGQYKYCTQDLKTAEDFVIRYAEKNNIKNIYK
jgi:hypothetical protein